MFKKYHIHAGMHVAISISIIMSIPRIIRFENIDMLHSLYQTAYTFFFSMCIWLISEYFLSAKPICNKYSKIALAMIIGTATAFFLQKLGTFLFNDVADDNIRFGVVFNLNEQQQLYMYVFRGLTFTALTYFIAYNVRLVEEKQRTTLEIEMLKQENLEARLSLLKQQVSPHFLFNSLSTLKTIAPDSKTKNFVMQLSNVYRYLLKDNGFQNNNMVSLKEELEFTQSYIYILKERFEDALEVELKVSEDSLKKHLPPLALQILIENAIKHNVVCTDEPLRISIRTEAANLVVSNKILPKNSTEESLGIGLKNIKDRYKILQNKDIEIINSNKSFTVKLPLLD